VIVGQDVRGVQVGAVVGRGVALTNAVGVGD